MKSFFSDERINTGRQIELDMIKALCIILMIISHTFDVLVDDPSAIKTFIEVVDVFLGAAIFMFCMGVGMRYSRHQEAKDFLIRGIDLLTVGQILNLIRNCIPNLILYRIIGETYVLANAFLVLQADIMTFAGFAFIFMALLRRLKVSNLSMVVIGVVLNLFNYIQPHFIPSPDNYLLRMFIGFFITNKAESYFSLAAYFIFVAVGYYVGEWYPRIKDKDGLSSRVIMIGLPICLLYYVIRMNVDIPFMPEFNSELQYVYNVGADAYINILNGLVIIAICYKLSKVWGSGLNGSITYISSHINEYYCISSVLIYWSLAIYGLTGSGLRGGIIPLIYGIIAIFLTTMVIMINEKKFHIHIMGQKGGKKAVVYTIAWLGTAVAVAYIYPQLTEYATFWNEYLLS
ncbi:MAG: DUF1624 domain-containing protein [Lachnospiraceae bacterium]|nr:DUF1624 domain-containing protein [Lachnospiraceae bacterium]